MCCRALLSFRDPECEMRAGPRALSCWDSSIFTRWERLGVGPFGILAKDRLLWELPEGKHFPGAGRAGRAQGQPEGPQWALVWRFCLDSPSGPAPGLGWALLSDLQPDPPPEQPRPTNRSVRWIHCPAKGDAHRLIASARISTLDLPGILLPK